MLVIFFRAIILYIALLIVMRLMGKRQIGEMQPFEFIITLLIAELACIPMTDVSIPLSYGLVSVLAVFILHQLMSLIERTTKSVKFLLSGKPSVVITPDGVVLSELKKNNMDIADLAEAMRAQGYFSFDDLSYAIFESNGKLSALKNEDKQAKNQPQAPAYILISDGKAEKDNFELFDFTVDKILDKLPQKKKKLKDIEVFTLDINNRAYLKLKGEKYKILQF